MLFVMEPKELSKRDTMLLHLIPTLLVFLAFAGVSVWSSYSSRQDLQKEQDRIVSQNISSTEKLIEDRLAIYEEVLRAGEGLYNASSEVTRGDWYNFASTFDLSKRYPGIQGLSYVPVVTNEKLDEYTETIKGQGFPNFRVFPEGNREIYTPVTYIEPFNDRNKQALGYDLSTNSARAEALNRARDTDSPAISNKVTLVQDTDTPGEPGFLMVLPVYEPNKPVSTVSERQQAIKGYITAPFRTQELFGGIFDTVNSDSPHVGFKIFDGSAEANNLLYESPSYMTIKQSLGKDLSSRLKIDGRDLIIFYKISPEIIGKTIRNRPINTLLGGLLFSAILAGLVLVLLISRTRALRYAEAREVQQAKDDLLSLASHQLRTPATGVKQYVGMLRQGYAGKLTKTQIELLEKAYQSNERQLGIIDEILHVARIDTGRITLNIERFDISKLVHDVVNEQREGFARKQQKLHLHLPKKRILLQADPQYLRMVVENIINNASKYTPEKGKIDVYLYVEDQNIVFEVKDTGVGIADQQQDLLFKKFSRIHNDLTRQTEGSGIGLYITRKIIDLHNGTIVVNSEPSIGSTFTVTLPKKPSARQQAV